MSSLAALPYDAMHSIVALLSSYYALNLALTSRSFHDLAINQASTYVYGTGSTKLLSAWKCLVEREPERARHVRTLCVGHRPRTEFAQEDWEAHTSNEDEEFVEGRDPCVLVSDLLLEAQGTSRVFVGGTRFMEDARVSAAMQSLKHLVHLHVLGGYNHKTFAAIGALHSPLQILSIHAETYSIMNTVPVLEVLIAIASHRTSLRALRLIGPTDMIHTRRALEMLEQLPCFPLCLRLVLAQSDLALPHINIFAAFPNLEAVEFPYNWHSDVLTKVPRLSHLQLYHRHSGSSLNTSWSVRYLHNSSSILLGEETRSGYVESQLSEVREVSPVGLHLELHMFSAVNKTAYFCDVLAPLTPRLRCLDIQYAFPSCYKRSRLVGDNNEIALWMRRLSFKGQASLPLMCLRIGMNFRPAFGISMYFRPWFDGKEPAENHSAVADAILAMPETIATSIPTLQYLAISAQTDYYRSVRDIWFNEESYYDLHALDADVTWWRIEREGGCPVLHRISLVEGAHVWRSLIEEDEDGHFKT